MKFLPDILYVLPPKREKPLPPGSYSMQIASVEEVEGGRFDGVVKITLKEIES